MNNINLKNIRNKSDKEENYNNIRENEHNSLAVK